MNHTNLIFVAFSFIVGILVFAIWSNTHVFAQQSSSLPSSGGSGSNSPSNPISSELKAKMCDPSNPDLKVVNTTESRLCGIAKTVKPPIASAATPPTSAVSSSSSSAATQQTTTTKSTAATNAATPPKQQPVKTSNNITNAISRHTVGSTGTTISPVSNTINKSLSSTSLSSAIAPQVKAINQQQQLPAPSPITLINSTAGQNDTFAAAPPAAASDKLMYLGYHGSDSSPNYKSSSDSKQPSIYHSSSTTTSNENSTGKTVSSSPKKDKISSSKSFGSINDGSESLSLLPDLESAIKNKVDSIIKNTFSSIKDNTPFLLPFP
jgi:hypothetical protein